MGEMSEGARVGRTFNVELRPVARELLSALDPIDYAISHCQRTPTPATIRSIRDRINWAIHVLEYAENVLSDIENGN